MNKLSDYFHTDWAAMTSNDWLGLVMTIVVFLVMLGLYLYVFHPANKERLESQRFIPLDDEDLPAGSRQHFPQKTEDQQ
ncbi:MAG TPA: cbb3-type cytochrome c oxidase subunit 3 [Gammaproteobacteria bacterium]|nr:cbb3-type cytochrome c oxidase subunit 3 [Gammaproteobacteria bacterium]